MIRRRRREERTAGGPMTAEDLRELEDDARIAGTVDATVAMLTLEIAKARQAGHGPLDVWELRVRRAARRFDRKVDGTARRDVESLMADFEAVADPMGRTVARIDAWNLLGDLTIGTRRSDVAAEAYGNALALLDRIVPADHDQRQFAASNVSLALCRDGRFAEALRYALPLLELRRTRYPATDVRVERLAALVAEAEQRCAPEELWAARAAVTEGRATPDGPPVAHRHQTVAALRPGAPVGAPAPVDLPTALLQLRGLLGAGLDPLPALEDVLAAAGAGDHGAVAVARQQVGEWLAERGRYTEAVEQFHGAMRGATAALGADHPLAVDAAESLAAQLLRTGRHEDAVAVQRSVVLRLVSQRGNDDERCLQARVGLVQAIVARSAEDAAAAAEAMSEALTTLADVQRVLGDRHPLASSLRSVLGAA